MAVSWRSVIFPNAGQGMTWSLEPSNGGTPGGLNPGSPSRQFVVMGGFRSEGGKLAVRHLPKRRPRHDLELGAVERRHSRRVEPREPEQAIRSYGRVQIGRR